MRQVNMTSLGDDARETRTIAGFLYVLHKPGQCCVQVWISTCERNDGGLEQSAHANGNWCHDVNVCLLWQSWTRESEVDSAMPSAAIVVRLDISERCADTVASQVPRAAVARVLAKAARAVETQDKCYPLWTNRSSTT